MSWGATLSGLSGVMQMLDAVEVQFDDNVVYVVGPTVEYGIYQELGTSNMPPQPFLFPAAREVNRELDTIAADANSTEDLVRRAALEIQRRAKERAPVDTGTLRASISAERIQ